MKLLLIAPVAQLVERQVYTLQAPDQRVIRVRISAGASNDGGCSSDGRAPVCETGRRRFEPGHSPWWDVV